MSHRRHLRACPAGPLLSAILGALTIPLSAMEVNFVSGAMVALVGEPVKVTVQIDYQPAETAELFSFGVRLVPDRAEDLSVEKIAAAPELDHTGFVAGALTSEVDLGVKGNVSLAGQDLVPYQGSLLACFLLTVDRPGTVQLSLDFFRTAGPQEDVFVTTTGITLDPVISFGSATLHVIEDPQFRVEKAPEDGWVEVSFETTPGLRYLVFRSHDLQTWKVISTISRPDGLRETVPVSTAGSPKSFFRLEVAAGPGG